MEAEIIALETTTIKVEWLCDLLMDLHMVEKPISTIITNYDNQTTIIKVNSANKNNAKSLRHVKSQLKFVSKLRKSKASFGCRQWKGWYLIEDNTKSD
jgi:hypothetical protein